MPYKKVFHTIPCDGFYDTTEEIVTGVLRSSLRDCVDSGDIRTVALSALATGYGRLCYDDFFRIASLVLAEGEFKVLDTATICISNEYAFGLESQQIDGEALRLTKASSAT